MKIYTFVAFFLFTFCFCLLNSANSAIEITLKENADLINDTGKVLITARSGDKFSFDYIDGDWVYGSYTHDAGITRGKIKASSFREQAFLKQKSAEREKEMAEKGLVKYEGKWIPVEEKEKIENEAKGLIKFEDKWITPEEKDNIIAQREAEKKAAEEEAKKIEEEKKESPEEVDETSETIEDVFIDDVEQKEDVEEKIEEDKEPQIEDLAEKEKEKKGIDYTKTSKKDGKESKEEKTLSPELFGKIFLPVMIGLTVIMITIVIISSRKSSKKK